MRYLLLSDIHGNLHALEAVLDAAQDAAHDRVLVLGDLVGYGADPNGVIDRVRALEPEAIIRGNHDKVACGLADAEDFNQLARAAALWTSAALTPENRAYLRALPAGPLLVGSDIEFCHGAPFDEDAYIFDGPDALEAFITARRGICFFGHTHLPAVFIQTGDSLSATVPDPDTATVLALEPGARYLVNPGSVGQPRDGDPRAAFAVYDEQAGEVRLRRVTYRVDLAQEAILNAGLPQRLAHRLALGR